MSSQMSFVCVTQTGNVLAFVTTVAKLSTQPTAADLASPALLVRDIPNDSAPPITIPTAVFNITPDQLTVFTGDVIDDAQLNPRNYWLNPTSKVVEALSTLITPVTVTAKTTQVLIKLPAGASGPAQAALIYPGSDPTKSQIISTTITGTSATLTPSGLIAGEYVLVLVAGYPPVMSKVS